MSVTATRPSVGSGARAAGTEVALFGGCRVEHDGTAVPLPVGGRRLVAYLALQGRTPRQTVAGTLWSGSAELQAAGSLRSTLWRVQRARPGLVRDVGGVLALSPEVRVDVRGFAASARRVVDDEAPFPRDFDAVLRAGELLPGWYDDWVLFERERLRQLRLHALDVIALAWSRAGRHGEALDVALRALGGDPLRESAYRTVIVLHLAESNLVEAVRTYRRCRDVLATELGVPPSADTGALLARAGVDPREV